jgi:hypothetical protein
VGVCWMLFVETEQDQIHSLPNWELWTLRGWLLIALCKLQFALDKPQWC